MKDIELTPGERERHDVIRACIGGALTNKAAAARLGLRVRQVQNLKQAIKKRGETGAAHGNRGRAPKRATDARTKEVVVSFLKKKDHRDFGPTFAAEQLAKQEKISLSRETVRAIMTREGLWKPRARSGPAMHREWRDRMPMYGQLVQFDGSYHDWFENGGEQCLLAAIDDATGEVMRAVFDDNESVAAVFRFWRAYVEARGRPAALYMDKFSTYKVNHKNAADNEELMTQFTRAMRELDIRVINANSPEAKGRIERLFGTLQDRLVKELRLAGIKDRASANRFLAETYLPEHNDRFAVPPRQGGDAHRPLTGDLGTRLQSVFSIQSRRTVNNDFTLRFKNQWFQLDAIQKTAVYRGDTVTIEERLDGTLRIMLKETHLSYKPIGKLERAARPRVAALTREKPRWKPPADHPWRRAATDAAERKDRKKSRHAR